MRPASLPRHVAATTDTDARHLRATMHRRYPNRRHRSAPPTRSPPPTAPACALLGRLDRQPADRHRGALGHERGLRVRADGRQEALAGQLLRPLRQLLGLRRPCSFYNFPAGAMDSIRAHGSIPFFSWGSQSIPSSKERAQLPALRRDRRHLRRLHPRIRRSGAQGLGPPLLPPLQLGDERQLVPLVGGRQRQQARRIRRRLAPRARHLHRGRRRPT